MMNYFMPARMCSGEGAVEKNASRMARFGDRCLIVTGRNSARACGALDDVTRALGSQGVAWSLFDGISSNPSVSSCLEAGRAARESGAEFVIGIGGGSVLDAAKAAAISAANPELDESGLYSKNWKNPPLPTVLVGTTSGTGSEVTCVSVLTDSHGRKKSINDPRIFASLSLGDPRYTMSAPRTLTLTTAVDALAHCTESYFSKKADSASKGMSVCGVRMLARPLSRATEGSVLTPADRESLYDASIFGGLAISVTGTCFPHNVGYYLTESRGVPHGFACAYFLCDYLDLAEATDPRAAEAFYRDSGVTGERLREIIRAALPGDLSPLSDGEIEEQLPRWENNGTVMNSPGNVDKEFIRRVLKGL